MRIAAFSQKNFIFLFTFSHFEVLMDVNNKKLVTILKNKEYEKVSSYNGSPRGNGNSKFCTVSLRRHDTQKSFQQVKLLLQRAECYLQCSQSDVQHPKRKLQHDIRQRILSQQRNPCSESCPYHAQQYELG